jgi:ATP-dependent protease HslVU (ClpYQ) peptidase subunit
MAADSLVNVYDRAVPAGARKIRRVKAGRSEALVAGAGHSGILAAISRLNLETEPANQDDAQRWAESVAVQATRLAVDLSLLDDGTMNGTVLLGWGGRLWTISHATAIPHADGIAAIGCGEGLAIGAIDALLDAGLQITPTDLVVRAVTLAIARDGYSEPPIQFEALPAARS